MCSVSSKNNVNTDQKDGYGWCVTLLRSVRYGSAHTLKCVTVTSWSCSDNNKGAEYISSFCDKPEKKNWQMERKKKKKKETKTKGHIYATELYSKNQHHKSLDFEKKAELIRRFCFFSSYPVPVQSSRLETKALFALSWSIVMVTLVLFAEWKGKSWYRAASQVDGTTMNWACRFSAFPCPENAAILLDEPYIPENNSVAER